MPSGHRHSVEKLRHNQDNCGCFSPFSFRNRAVGGTSSHSRCRKDRQRQADTAGRPRRRRSNRSVRVPEKWPYVVVVRSEIRKCSDRKQTESVTKNGLGDGPRRLPDAGFVGTLRQSVSGVGHAAAHIHHARRRRGSIAAGRAGAACQDQADRNGAPIRPGGQHGRKLSSDVPRIFDELSRLGFVEGKNLIVERYSAEGQPDRYPQPGR
jgi:hypothetical protein